MHYTEFCTIKYAWVAWDEQGQISISEPEVEERKCFRVARLLDEESERILFLYFPSRPNPRLFASFLKQVGEKGVTIGKLQ